MSIRAAVHAVHRIAGRKLAQRRQCGLGTQFRAFLSGGDGRKQRRPTLHALLGLVQKGRVGFLLQ